MTNPFTVVDLRELEPGMWVKSKDTDAIWEILYPGSACGSAQPVGKCVEAGYSIHSPGTITELKNEPFRWVMVPGGVKEKQERPFPLPDGWW